MNTDTISNQKTITYPLSPTTSVNWGGLWTIIRRDTARFLRVPIQTLIAPWISALLFIFIFGYVVGGRIQLIDGYRYIEFVLPGILMMNIVNASFLQSSSQMYFQRFLKYVEELLVSPLSYAEMIIGSLIVTVFRSVITALGILLIAACFGATTMHNFGAFMFWVVAVSVAFGLLGMLIGLWANNFEQLTILNVFLITPLSFFGGIFNTVSMLPSWIQPVAYVNPFFYFINGLREAMIGYSDGPQLIGIGLTLALIAVLGVLVWHLFSIGWRLRE